MKIKPLSNYGLLKVSDYSDDPSKSGIILPQKYRKKIPKGVVVDKGNYVTDIEIGETVIFSKQQTKALPNDLVLAPIHRILLKGEE